MANKEANTRAAANYRKRQQRERKLTRISVWVPEAARELMIETARKLRQQCSDHTNQE